jgi:dipeptidyl-peptidase-4
MARLHLIGASLLFAAACSTPESGERTSQFGADGPLTLDDVFELNAKLRLRAQPQGWLDDNRYLAVAPDPADAARKLFVVEAGTGAAKPFFDAAKMKAAFQQLEGVDAKRAEGYSKRTSLDLTADKRGALLNDENDLYFYDFGASRAVRLTNDPREEVGETLSPDGRQVGFIADWNLHVVATDGASPARALSTGGDENHLHGRLDWVYQEEVYGRGNFGAFWWSPDSKRIAYLIIDETKVPTYTVTDHRPRYPEFEDWRYPKSGDPNPIVQLAVVDVAGGATTKIDLTPWSAQEFLIVRVGWTPDSSRVVFQVQDRVQTWIEVVGADPQSGATTKLLRDSTATWIEPDDGPYWIDGGERFLWRSERDGWAHLYLYDKTGALLGRVTQGEWEVDSFVRYDAVRGVAYFLCDRDDVKGSQLYRCKLDGSKLERVTRGAGTHSISLSPGAEFALDTHSSTSDWTRLSLVRADGELVREIERVDGTAALRKGVTAPEYFKVKTRDGFEMEAMMFKPADFERGKRYPVLCHVYSGPHAPKVTDRALSFDALWHAMLAQQGYLVWICDNRSASGKGHVSQEGVYKNLGAQELRDIEDGVDWLVAQGYADPARIGLWGWSYGGYQTAYALTHSTKFKVGISGAPVTDWHYYDSIYTERFMLTPQLNPAGYKSSSVVEAAANLSGKLLLIHGVIDENVHLQNTLNLAGKLQAAGKSFDLMVYPGNRHAVVEPRQRRHLYQMMTDYVREHL